MCCWCLSSCKYLLFLPFTTPRPAWNCPFILFSRQWLPTCDRCAQRSCAKQVDIDTDIDTWARWIRHSCKEVMHRWDQQHCQASVASTWTNAAPLTSEINLTESYLLLLFLSRSTNFDLLAQRAVVLGAVDHHKWDDRRQAPLNTVQVFTCVSLMNIRDSNSWGTKTTHPLHSFPGHGGVAAWVGAGVKDDTSVYNQVTGSTSFCQTQASR